MKNVLCIHGAFGNPEENWFPWFKKELETLGYTVTVPQFPSAEEQGYESWMRVIAPPLEELNEETVLVGHSVGATFALCILEKLNIEVSKTILVSGFLGSLGIDTFDEVNRTITERTFDWEHIKKHSKSFHIFHGDNDPYVPLSKAQELGQHLGIAPTVIQNGGHLNESAGFREFPQVLELLGRRK